MERLIPATLSLFSRRLYRFEKILGFVKADSPYKSRSYNDMAE